jgi:hypothetical protein
VTGPAGSQKRLQLTVVRCSVEGRDVNLTHSRRSVYRLGKAEAIRETESRVSRRLRERSSRTTSIGVSQAAISMLQVRRTR